MKPPIKIPGNRLQHTEVFLLVWEPNGAAVKEFRNHQRDEELLVELQIFNNEAAKDTIYELSRGSEDA